MSYQKSTVTICDYCGNSVYDKREEWRVGWRYTDEGKEPIHLCPGCQGKVWYCSNCEEFHPLDETCLASLGEETK